MIDSFIVVLLYFLYVVIYIEFLDSSIYEFIIPYYVEVMVIQFIYYVGFAVINNGKTFGKMIFGIKIYGGSKPYVSKGSIIIREFVKVMMSGIDVISFIVCASRKDHKSLHDLLTDTIVLKRVKYVTLEDVLIEEEDVEVDPFAQYLQ
jgi:uncharacterized RDD family membrane protein YckC